MSEVVVRVFVLPIADGEGDRGTRWRGRADARKTLRPPSLAGFARRPLPASGRTPPSAMGEMRRP
jgi:hypothetical protein